LFFGLFRFLLCFCLFFLSSSVCPFRRLRIIERTCVGLWCKAHWRDGQSGKKWRKVAGPVWHSALTHSASLQRQLPLHTVLVPPPPLAHWRRPPPPTRRRRPSSRPPTRPPSSSTPGRFGEGGMPEGEAKAACSANCMPAASRPFCATSPRARTWPTPWSWLSRTA
jgi:hypothetical protein